MIILELNGINTYHTAKKNKNKNAGSVVEITIDA